MRHRALEVALNAANGMGEGSADAVLCRIVSQANQDCHGSLRQNNANT